MSPRRRARARARWTALDRTSEAAAGAPEVKVVRPVVGSDLEMLVLGRQRQRQRVVARPATAPHETQQYRVST